MAETAKFSIQVKSNAAQTAKQDTSALEAFRTKIQASERAIKDYNASLSKLKGSSEQITKAKAELQAKVRAERDAIAAANLEILKAGSSFEQLKKRTDEAKKASDEHRKKSLELADAVGGILVGAILAVEAAIIAATAKFALFVIESANLARSQQLVRVAMVGSEEDAKRLGNQVDALARKVPTARNEINELASDLSRVGLGGQTLVDTLNAATQAQAALGGNAGNRVRELVERGRLMGNFSLGPLETQGLGVSFGDVAASLAKNTKTSVQDAAQALVQGRVKMADGAAALRTAMEKRFAGVNLAKMLDLDVMKEKFSETLGSLTRDINLEPLLKDIQAIFAFFDPSTENGAQVKAFVTLIGQGLVDAIHKAFPIFKGAFEGAMSAVLDLTIDVLEVAVAVNSAFGGSDVLGNIDLFKTGVEGAKLAVEALAVVVAVLAGTTLLMLTPMIAAGAALYAVYSVIKTIWDVVTGLDDAMDSLAKTVSDKLIAIDWKSLGDSIVKGLTSAIDAVEDVGKNLADKLKTGFKDALGIHSPSTVFAELGGHVADGFAQGMARGSDAINAAAGDMGSSAKSGAKDGAASGGRSIIVQAGAVQITIDAAGSSRADLEDAGFLAKLTHAVELGLHGAGVPTA